MMDNQITDEFRAEHPIDPQRLWMAVVGRAYEDARDALARVANGSPPQPGDDAAISFFGGKDGAWTAIAETLGVDPDRYGRRAFLRAAAEAGCPATEAESLYDADTIASMIQCKKKDLHEWLMAGLFPGAFRVPNRKAVITGHTAWRIPASSLEKFKSWAADQTLSL